jgi:hypothetical protein
VYVSSNEKYNQVWRLKKKDNSWRISAVNEKGEKGYLTTIRVSAFTKDTRDSESKMVIFQT